jgi:hypothetical protein
MINLYSINNNFLPFIIEFLRKKIVVKIPNNINLLEYFIEDNIYRITLERNHYYYFVNEIDRVNLITNIRNNILKVKREDTLKLIDIVNQKFMDDESYDIRINSIKSMIELIDFYETNDPLILYQSDNLNITNILNYYSSIMPS